jgi:tetratricopeptide (TPR) repeat protein
MTLVGRGRELAELRAGLAEALAGSGRLFLIAGDPGVGKTSLADTISREASAQDARTLWGRCWEGGGAPAYWPWIQVVRAHAREHDPDVLSADLGDGAAAIAAVVPEVRERLPDLGEPPAMDTEGARFALFEAVSAFLRRASARCPLVLVLDDLHAADTASLLLLRFVARDLHQGALLVVGTYRELEVTLDADRSRVMAEVRREAAPIQLGGLSEGEVRELVQLRAGVAPSRRLAEELYRTTEGNPFFVDEVVRVLSAEGRLEVTIEETGGVGLPHGVRETIGRRLEHLSAGSREVLEVAAVVGREFDLEVLARVCDRAPASLVEALDEAIALAVVEELSGPARRYGFAHGLFRETLYEAIRARERIALHRRVGEALEVGRGDTVHPAELAHHFIQAAAAGDGATKAVDYAAAAGAHADERLAYEEAAGHYERALAALEWITPADDARRCDLLLALGDSQWRAAATEPAKRTFEKASELARRVESGERLAHAALGFGGRFAWVEATGAVDDRLVGLLQGALDLLGDRDPPLRARLMGRLAMQLYFSEQRYAEAQRIAREAVDLARDCGDLPALAYALNARRFTMWGRPVTDERIALSSELLDVAGEAGETELILRAYGWLAIDRLEAGDIPGVDRAIAQHARMAAELRQPLYASEGAKFRAMRGLLDGRLAEAEGLIQEFAASADRIEDPDVAQAVGIQMFVLRGLQGRLSELEDGARVFAEEFPLLPAWQCGLAFLCGEIGLVDEARRRYRALTDESFWATNQAGGWLIGICALSELCAQFDDRDGAPKLYAMLDPFAGTNVVIGYSAASFGSADRPLGVLATVLRRYEQAEQHFRAALELDSRMGAAVFAGWTRCQYAMMLLTRNGDGDGDRAGELLEAALTATRDCGAERLARTCEWLLRHRERLIGADFGVIAAEHAAAARGEAPAVEPPAVEAPAAGAVPQVLFVRSGDYWTIGEEGSRFRLKDAKGLRYLARLLSAPDMEWHAADLVSDGGASAAAGPAAIAGEAEPMVGLGDAGAILDDEAKRSYRERIEELREDLAEAESFGDPERASRSREELEFVAAELAGAVGLGGRDRKAASSSERARVNATRAIKLAIQRITENDEGLGRHLAAAVRTGTFCSYVPEPRARVEWTLEEEAGSG